jgi:NAD(P)H-hydrate epimerase
VQPVAFHFYTLLYQTNRMKGLSTKEIRKLEEKAKSLGLTERILIEDASSNLANIIDSLNLGKCVLAVAGRGNNGADVLACARKLFAKDYCVGAVLIKEKAKEVNAEVNFQKNILKKIKIPLSIINEDNIKELKKYLQNCDFIIDGILGTGIKGKVSNFLEEVINIVNTNAKLIVACDIPSGLSPDEGVPLPAAIKADYTVTFLAPKRGFFLKPAGKFCGKIFITDIGIASNAPRIKV